MFSLGQSFWRNQGSAPVLDQLSVQSVAAYSTRKLRAAYNGAALRVRRSFDSAESDIGFVGNDFDTTALMNFVGSQNLLLHSDGLFTSPWIAGPAHTRSANADVAPDGTTTATLITNTNASTGNFTYQLQSTVTSQRTFSVYGKAGTNRYLWVYGGINTTDNYGALFDLQDGVFVLDRVKGSVTSASASIQSVGNGWFRCSITHTQATNSYVAVTSTNNPNPTFSANNDITNCTAGTVLVWGGQFNQGTLQPYSSTTTTARDGNGFVPTWYDQSGNGRNLTQATAANQPQLVSAGVLITDAGRPTIRFDGTDDELANTAFVSPVGSSPRSINTVYRPLRTTGTNSICGQGSGTGTGSWFMLQSRQVPAGNPYFAGRSADLTDNQAPTLDAKVATVRFDSTTTTLFRNGTQFVQGTPVLDTIGTNFYVGRSSGGEFGQLLVSEVTVFASALSTAERQTIETNQLDAYLPFILDRIAASAAAFSTRRLRSAYTGACMRVRRSSDNAELDIGFTASGDLDTAALLTHCGANDGFVTTWYDQSGNARDVVMVTAATQPSIVTAGVLETINGRPAINSLLGRRLGRGTTSILRNAPGATIVAVYRPTLPLAGVEANGAVVFVNQGTVLGGSRALLTVNPSPGTAGRYSVGGRRLDTDGYTPITGPTDVTANPAIWAANFDYANARVNTWLNGSADIANAAFQTAGNSDNTDSLGVGLFDRPNGGLATYDNTRLSECLIFDATLSTADRRALERNEGAYFGVTVA